MLPSEDMWRAWSGRTDRSRGPGPELKVTRPELKVPELKVTRALIRHFARTKGDASLNTSFRSEIKVTSETKVSEIKVTRSLTRHSGGLCFRQPGGRPLGRRLCCRPRTLAVRFTHGSSPRGRERSTCRRIALRSSSVKGVLSRSGQLAGRRTGQSASSGRSSCERLVRTKALPHRHRSARLASVGRTALRSTYRSTFSR